jgi:hypothetical protein
MDCYDQLYKGPINSIIKSQTRLISHANPGYVTILSTSYKILSNITLPSLSPYLEEIIGYHQCMF